MPAVSLPTEVFDFAFSDTVVAADGSFEIGDLTRWSPFGWPIRGDRRVVQHLLGKIAGSLSQEVATTRGQHRQ